MSPHPLAGRTVLDAGAGTGAVSSALTARRARPVAMDLSVDMLACNARARPPGRNLLAARTKAWHAAQPTASAPLAPGSSTGPAGPQPIALAKRVELLRRAPCWPARSRRRGRCRPDELRPLPGLRQPLPGRPDSGQPAGPPNPLIWMQSPTAAEVHILTPSWRSGASSPNPSRPAILPRHLQSAQCRRSNRQARCLGRHLRAAP